MVVIRGSLNQPNRILFDIVLSSLYKKVIFDSSMILYWALSQKQKTYTPKYKADSDLR